uniref:Uncharacterized protein n=1 Tax=Avena sativa TaxID=4498 RepID=A0ACD5Y9N8_AVESA
MESAGDPDVWALFRHYDELYFRGALVNAAFSLEWARQRKKTISAFGSCSFRKMRTITLYRTNRTSADLKNALLHLMIHAIIFVKHGLTCLSSHGPVFRDWMDAINACTIEDYLRPKRGYRITTTHDFSMETPPRIQGNLWKCKSCGVTLVRATKLGPPSDSCCIENVSQHATCGNMLCYWHNHKLNCGGTYVVPGRQGQKMVPKGYAVGCKQGLLTETSKSQESNSDEVQENSTVARPNAEGKLLSQVGSRNTRSPRPRRKLKPKQEFVASEKQELFSMVSCNNAKLMGSCSSKKAEDFQKAIVSSTSSLSTLKRKQPSVSSEKHELVSLGSCNNAKSSSDTSKKAGKWQDSEHVQKSSVQPATLEEKPKQEQDLGVSEKYGVFSPGSYNTAKPPGSSTSRKACNRHTPEGVEKSSFPVAAPQKKLKLEPDLVALQQNKTNSSIKAWKQLNPEDCQKTFVQPAVSQKNLKLEPDLVALEKHGDAKPLGCSTGNKEGKLHKLEGIRKASVLPPAPHRKLEQDLVASQKNELSSCVGRSNANILDNISSKKAHKQREHEETRKPIAWPAAPQSILMQQSKTNSSTKAEKQQIPEYFQRTFVQSAVSQSKLKRSNRVVPERPKTQRKTSKSARKKEYACVSVWANIYEYGCSSGSDEPLVNKRTERRKRERERAVQITYSRSRKRSGSGISSMKAQPDEEVSCQQTKPPTIIFIDAAVEVVTQDTRDYQLPAPRMDIAGVPPANQVKTQPPRDQIQPPARFLDTAALPPTDRVMTQAPVHQSQSCSIATDKVVPPHSAVPPSLPPSNPSSSPDVIDISDDD